MLKFVTATAFVVMAFAQAMADEPARSCLAIEVPASTAPYYRYGTKMVRVPVDRYAQRALHMQLNPTCCPARERLLRATVPGYDDAMHGFAMVPVQTATLVTPPKRELRSCTADDILARNEASAVLRLRLAKRLTSEASRPEQITRLEAIVGEYPNTRAGKEACELLAELSRQEALMRRITRARKGD